MFRDVSISRRLLSLTSLAALLTAVVGAVALAALWRAAEIGEGMDAHARTLELGGLVHSEAAALRRHEPGLRGRAASPDVAAARRTRFLEADARLREELFAFEQRAAAEGRLGEDDREAITAIRGHLDAYGVVLAEAFSRSRDARGVPAAEGERLATRAESELAAIHRTAAELVARGRARRLSAQAELEGTLRAFVPILGGAVVALILFSLWVGRSIQRSVARPLVQTLRALEAVAGGDLSPELEVGRTDELGRIATSLNTAVARMRRDREEIERLAATDALTGLMNRRAFTAALTHEVARSRRYHSPLSLLLLDVDHFKRINDTHGHAAGDLVLARLGALIRAELRGTDLPARWGGEEFVAALPHTDLDGASVAAGRLRVACQEMVVSYEGGPPIPVTISIGAAELTADVSLEGLTERADHAMYAAKHRGRNRVVVYDAEVAGAAASRVTQA